MSLTYFMSHIHSPMSQSPPPEAITFPSSMNRSCACPYTRLGFASSSKKPSGQVPCISIVQMSQPHFPSACLHSLHEPSSHPAHFRASSSAGAKLAHVLSIVHRPVGSLFLIGLLSP